MTKINLISTGLLLPNTIVYHTICVSEELTDSALKRQKILAKKLKAITLKNKIKLSIVSLVIIVTLLVMYLFFCQYIMSYIGFRYSNVLIPISLMFIIIYLKIRDYIEDNSFRSPYFLE